MLHKYFLFFLLLFGTQKFGRCDENLGFEESKVKLLSGSKELEGNKYELTKQISVLQYKFHEGTECTEVKYDNNTVWKNSESSNPQGLFFKTGGQIVIAMKDSWDAYTLNNGNWSLKSQTPMKTIELDINNKQSTDKYIYAKNQEGELYMSHAEHYFNVVKDGNQNLFEVDNSVEYARKAKLNKETETNTETLELELLTGDIIVYKKEDNGSWKCTSGCDKKSSLRGSGRKSEMKLNKTMIALIAGGIVVLLLVVVAVFLCKK